MFKRYGGGRFLREPGAGALLAVGASEMRSKKALGGGVGVSVSLIPLPFSALALVFSSSLQVDFPCLSIHVAQYGYCPAPT